MPNYKDPLPREYLVKWTARGFRHVSYQAFPLYWLTLQKVTWVPHAWLVARAHQKLRNFLDKGPTLDLLTDATLAAKGDDVAEPTIAKVMADDDTIHGQKGRSHHPTSGSQWIGHGPAPDTNAEASIPIEWSVSKKPCRSQLI
jgi:hypothetical protein